MRTVASLSLPLLSAMALLVVPLAACGGRGGSQGSAGEGSAFALHGAYVSSPLAPAEYSSISFLTTTTFMAVKSGCGGSPSCRVDGTYVYDGAHDLALTNGATRTTAHLVIQSLSTAAAAGASAAQATRPLDLITGGDGGALLVSASSGPLLPTITSATIGGAPVAYLEGDDPPPLASEPLIVPLASKPGTVTVMLQVGRRGTPVEALLDTGSSGIWIDSSVMHPGDGIDQQTTASTAYGDAQQLSGEVVSAFVTLGGVRTLGAIPVGVVTAATCAGESCDGGTGDVSAIGLAGSSLHAIVGIGMDRSAARAGIVSPFGCMGQQTEQFLLSIGAAGNANARLIIDPAGTDQAGFAAQALTGSTQDGYGAGVVPFCISGACVTGLLDSGETEAILKATPNATTLAELQQTEAPTSVARGVQLVDPVSLSVLGRPDVPSRMSSGVPGTLVQIRPDAVGNNLGILAFRGLDVLYDAWNGSVGVRALTNESLGVPDIPSQVIPVQAVWSPAATKVTIQLTIGGSPPITATLDTGSVGIKVLATAVKPSAWQVSATALPTYTYGGAFSVDGFAAQGMVQLGGASVPTMMTVDAITTVTCLSPGSSCSATGPTLPNGYAAVVGVGMRATGPLMSPLIALGQTGAYELALPHPNESSGSIIVDPPSTELARFTSPTQLPSLPTDGSISASAWNDTVVPFCINQYCSTGLFDTGGDRATLYRLTDADYGALGAAPGATTFAPGAQVTEKVDQSVSWSFQVGAPAESGVDLFSFKGSTPGANNLGPAAFYVNDALYDYGQGTIAFAPKQ